MALTEFDVFNRALSRLGDLRLTLETAQTLTSATAANPIVVTKAAHGYSNGDLLLLTGMATLTQVNGRIFEVANKTTNTFELRDEDGSLGTAGTGGNAAKITTAKAARATFDAWRGSTGMGVRDEVFRDHPWNAIGKYTRLARLAAAQTITGATAANPVVLTIATHGYSSGDFIRVRNVGGMIQLSERYFQVGQVLTVNTFQLAGEDGTAHTAYTSGGTAEKALTPLRPDFNFTRRYDLPTDCLRVLELVDSLEQWEVVGRELYTDEGITVPIRYCKRELDPTRWDAKLVSALAARLAMECGEELSTSTSKVEKAQAEYEMHVRSAKGVDAQEASPSEFAEDDWVLARR